MEQLRETCLVNGPFPWKITSVTWWCKKFKNGVDSVEDAPHACHPKTATSQKIVEKVMNLLLQMQDLQLGIKLNVLVSQ